MANRTNPMKLTNQVKPERLGTAKSRPDAAAERGRQPGRNWSESDQGGLPAHLPAYPPVRLPAGRGRPMPAVAGQPGPASLLACPSDCLPASPPVRPPACPSTGRALFAQLPIAYTANVLH